MAPELIFRISEIVSVMFGVTKCIFMVSGREKHKQKQLIIVRFQTFTLFMVFGDGHKVIFAISGVVFDGSKAFSDFFW